MASIATILNDAPSEYSGRTAAAEAQTSWPWISLGLQLGAALLLIHEFRLESRTFFYVAILVVCGFVVHAMLPLRARLPMFAAISIVSIVVAFGLRDAAVVFLLGVALIGICHLPSRLGFRVSLLLAVGALLVALRSQVLAPLGGAFASSILPFGVWAILGSMFMFRIALYVHAMHTRAADDPKPSVARTLAYFFMAPNVCFPLFPVVDYNSFARNYYDRPALEIYQTGSRWIARGLFHLLLYRAVYTIANDPAWLGNLGQLLQYLLATYLLYFRVSGTFHLIVGMLCLFGFRLPETHHLYFLATSFTDYWRRINIYWKDFMMKLVYYPSFFRLRKTTKSAVLPIVVSTLLVFVGTWALHSYQWYWLRGELLLSWPDVVFWSTLALLVVWNSLREARRGRQRLVSTGRTGWGDWRLSRAVKVVATFSTICILWSLWSAESIFDWVLMWRAAFNVRLSDGMVLLGLLAGGLLIGGRSWDATPASTAARRPWYRDPALTTFGLLLGPLVLSRPEIQGQFGPQGASFLESLQHTSLNSRDEARQHMGYYEKMDADARLTVALWEDTPAIPAGFVPFQHTVGRRERSDFLADELRPSITVPFLNQLVTINRWGMRGPDTQLEKPPGTFRIATVGQSYMFGWGVADSGRIQHALEGNLNAATRSGLPRTEVLDFSFPAYGITQQLAMLDDRVYNFAPDIVLISMDRWMYRHLEWHLDRVIAQRSGTPIPYAGLRELLVANGIELERQGRTVPFAWLRSAARTVGVQARQPQKETRALLRELSDTIAAWSISEIARSIRAHGAIPVAVAFEMLEFQGTGSFADVDRLMQTAEAAGMIVIDVRDVFRGEDPAALRVAPWDSHPNARGNRLIANKIAAELQPHILQRVRSTPWMTSSVR